MEARGYTILEIAVAIAVIGILAAAASWRASASSADLRLDAAARQVMLDIRLARGRAMAEQRNRRVLFSPTPGTYRRQYKSGSAYQDDGAAVTLPPGIQLVSCSAASSAISFAPRGTANTFGTVTLRNVNGREELVIVDIAGRVRVQ